MVESASLYEHSCWGKSRIFKCFIYYLGHYIHACPQIAKATLEVFDVDRATDHGDPWILLHYCHHAIPNIIPWGIVSTCMVDAWWPPGRVTPSGRHHANVLNGRLGLSRDLPAFNS